MANNNFDYEAVRDLLEGVSAVGRLAKDEKAFRQVYEAFRSGGLAMVKPRAGLDARTLTGIAGGSRSGLVRRALCGKDAWPINSSGTFCWQSSG